MSWGAHLDNGRDELQQEADLPGQTEGKAMSRGARLDDGRDQLQQEARHLEQGGVEVVEEVHDEALDVTEGNLNVMGSAP